MTKRLTKYLAVTGGKTRLFLYSIISVQPQQLFQRPFLALYHIILCGIASSANKKETFSLHAYNSIFNGYNDILFNTNKKADSGLLSSKSALSHIFELKI
ncbi:hypothetical protein [Fulvivirga ligni]|uniref:hypothetical protein n=1 Tax=Fulvivirga ligni TaxID=2904246 RepID=UPI001F45F672|nr:hypothetical protein [Fulvivirga ligni]UII22374.1 hypothetical protein LVD16_03905 [Fulvivirga ligni]